MSALRPMTQEERKFAEHLEETLRDFETRSMGVLSPQWFDVTINETLTLTVRVDACGQQEAEQIVSNDWRKQEFVLGPEHFAGVDFDAIPASGHSR